MTDVPLEFDPLKQLLADMASDADAARRLGHDSQARDLEARAKQIEAAAEPWLKLLSEEDARMKSGRSIRWLRASAPEWANQNLAFQIDGHWYFRDCAIPQRLHKGAAAEDARRAARGSAA